MAKKDGVLPAPHAPENYYGQIDAPVRREGCLNFAGMIENGIDKIVTPNGNAMSGELKDKANFYATWEEWERKN